jgi:hypothetical protein
VSQYNESPVDKAIREAQERGAFDDLPGAGKPLNLGDTNDPDWWVKGLIQREQLDMTAALPSGVALRREVERLPQTLADVRREDDVRAIVEDLNRRVLEDRRRLTDGPTILAPTVDVEQVVERWREARAQTEIVADPDARSDADATEQPREPHGWFRRLFAR